MGMLVHRLCFRLIPLVTDSTCFLLQLLSSLTVHPRQAEDSVSDQEMFQHICRTRAEHILNSHWIRAYGPLYDPADLEDWTLHLEVHSRAGIHQIRLLIEQVITQMQPG